MPAPDADENALPPLVCPTHSTSLQETPICPQCNFPLECPDHMMRVNIREMCNTCGRRRNEPAPEKPHPFPNRCRGHMLEWDADGKCGYCGRGPGDPVGPPSPKHKQLLDRWEQAVAAAEEYLAAQTQDSGAQKEPRPGNPT